ncbi:hypothetical protein F511_30795 [Dorcoceras hygrometricum]|uniref:Uncharacterized protein n=1 Tax=Dorcoceras hygrometricum TaxID=472368 RepID=A0A2Z7BLZ1_9LAMI|nr:hypothetical protein F511_30795 [Dorcoceras hygrometricum]
MYCSFLLVSCNCWLLTQRASAESLAQEQNAVVSTYVNDIVFLSLSPNSIFWLHSGLSSSAEHDVVTNDIITNPSADLAILLVDLLITMTSLMTLSSLVPDSLELAADS